MEITTDDAHGPHRGSPSLILATLLAGQMMASFDTEIVTVAAPTIRRDLHVPGSAVQLVLAAYVLAYAVLLVTGARLGADYGPRRLFLIGAAAFTAFSSACGLAPGLWELVGAQAGLGAAAALMVPQVLSLIHLTFKGAERARAVGLYSMVLATGVALGLVLGGLLLTADPLGLSWRPIFLINVPLGLLLLVAVPATLPRVGGLPGQGLDLPGVLTLGAGMVLLVAPLTFGPQERWPLWSRLGLAGAGLAGAAFVAVELLTLRRGRQPLLDLRTLLAPGVAAGLLVVLATMGSFGGFLFTISLYLQAGLGFTALAVGLTFLPYPAGFATVSLTWSRLAPARQRWLPTVGLTAMAAAVTVLALRPPSGWTPALIPVLVVAGAGHAASFSPLVARIAQGVGPERAAAFSALVTTTTQIAIVIGVALLGSLYLTAASSGRGLALVCAAVAAVTILGLPGSMRVAVRR